MSGPCANRDDEFLSTKPLGPVLTSLVKLLGDGENAGLTLREALEQVATPLGGDLWDMEGTVVEMRVSGRRWWFRPTGARRDAMDGYHGLSCSRCGGDVRHPVSVPGQDYLLGPFHGSCAREVEAEFQQQVIATLENREVKP